jgi:pyocin large subunit-like protein
MSSPNWTERSSSLCAGVFSILALGLAGCDAAPSATAARSHGAGEGSQVAARGAYDDAPTQRAPYGADSRSGGAAGERPAVKADLDADTPRYHGKPIWAANRNHSGQDNADYQFKRDGQDFGAANVDDFVAKAHDFIDHPPEGAQTLTRANGDQLIYDPKTNVFAVAAKDGAPRAMFKPRNGPAYWDQQKANLDQPYGGARRTAARRSSGQDDNG